MISARRSPSDADGDDGEVDVGHLLMPMREKPIQPKTIRPIIEHPGEDGFLIAEIGQCHGSSSPLTLSWSR